MKGRVDRTKKWTKGWRSTQPTTKWMSKENAAKEAAFVTAMGAACEAAIGERNDALFQAHREFLQEGLLTKSTVRSGTLSSANALQRVGRHCRRPG